MREGAARPEFRFAHGKTYAIVGPSGSGKSTLADILLGLVPPQAGTVSVNDGQRSLADVRGRIMLVEQQPKIFSTTVRENLLFGHQADDDTLWAALRMVDMQDHISAMRHGLDTPLSYLGENLSGGQRQRIGIARALVRRPDVLILDEATSALDAATRALVVGNIRAHLQDGILVFITHDAEIAELADERLVLQRNAGCRRGGRMNEPAPAQHPVAPPGDLAPVVLFCYMRPEHLARTVDSLQRNPEAARTHLRVYCDAARKPEHQAAVDAVRRFVATHHRLRVGHADPPATEPGPGALHHRRRQQHAAGIRARDRARGRPGAVAPLPGLHECRPGDCTSTMRRWPASTAIATRCSRHCRRPSSCAAPTAGAGPPGRAPGRISRRTGPACWSSCASAASPVTSTSMAATPTPRCCAARSPGATIPGRSAGMPRVSCATCSRSTPGAAWW
jgi:ABC-type nitrate/sulfonate/bicarbonate transport system ATPase subunit